ncbi:MAG: transketolase [Actinomycetota bacterium]|nr:transketolase [Actinomycetota bacterium]
MALEWTDLDRRAVDTARVLAMDAVQHTGNGHPGAPMALAPVAYLLYQRIMRTDPNDPHWLGRDRFVLSNGHASLTQYTQLYLGGYGLELSDLEEFRTWGSLTPGHPEFGHTVGIETTTGPLGQGISTAVGMAMDARFVRGLLDQSADPGLSPFDHRIYVIVGDGCLQEGISSEASSLAGHQQLGNLIVIYDDNHITIEGNTNLTFTEDVLARYEAYGWHTQHVDMLPNGDVDVHSLHDAILAAQEVVDRPSIIRTRSIIGWPAPNLQGTAKAHGSALGTAEVAATKEVLGFDPAKDFAVDPEVLAHTRQLRERGAQVHAAWDQQFGQWREQRGALAELLDRLRDRRLPADFSEAIPVFAAGDDMATRSSSGKVINAIAAVLPEFWGGSADLAGSNDTTIVGAKSFEPESDLATVPDSSTFGRLLHFGVREHAMGAALNGIAIGGLTRPFGGTFFTFSDYMRGAVRLAALMDIGVTYVWTHDSIGVGEDGPTHQPVEHLAALRAMPNLEMVRPADANEVAIAWRTILERGKPTGLVLTRQSVPTVDRAVYGSAEGVAKGGYVLSDCEGTPAVLLLATGSEVSIALGAQKALASEGIASRVVSMPCLEWFAEQDQTYRAEVIPPAVKARVSVEAGVAMPWYQWLGDAGKAVAIDHFGASANGTLLFREFGFTVDAVVRSAKESIAAATA